MSKEILVTTDNDYFNSADGANFHLLKEQVKPLPEKLTPIIERALEEGLIREATEKEIAKQKKQDEEEKMIKQGQAVPVYGKTHTETLKLREKKAEDKKA